MEGMYGSYVICDVCGWEDDGVQLANPTSEGGANKKSLAQAQEAALTKYPPHIQVAEGNRRGTKWRPLHPDEIEAANSMKATKHWISPAVVNEHEAYWCLA